MRSLTPRASPPAAPFEKPFSSFTSLGSKQVLRYRAMAILVTRVSARSRRTTSRQRLLPSRPTRERGSASVAWGGSATTIDCYRKRAEKASGRLSTAVSTLLRLRRSLDVGPCLCVCYHALSLIQSEPLAILNNAACIASPLGCMYTARDLLVCCCLCVQRELLPNAI